MDASRLCMNCMRDGGGYEVCMHCGYINGSQPAQNRYLPEGFLLGGRYCIGRMLKEDEFSCAYAAFDTQEEQRLLLWEWNPAGLVNRCGPAGALAPASGFAAKKQPRLQRAFFAQTEGMPRFSWGGTFYAVSPFPKEGTVPSLGRRPRRTAGLLLGIGVAAMLLGLGLLGCFFVFRPSLEHADNTEQISYTDFILSR